MPARLSLSNRPNLPKTDLNMGSHENETPKESPNPVLSTTKPEWGQETSVDGCSVSGVQTVSGVVNRDGRALLRSGPCRPQRPRNRAPPPLACVRNGWVADRCESLWQGRDFIEPEHPNSEVNFEFVLSPSPTKRETRLKLVPATVFVQHLWQFPTVQRPLQLPQSLGKEVLNVERPTTTLHVDFPFEDKRLSFSGNPTTTFSKRCTSVYAGTMVRSAILNRDRSWMFYQRDRLTVFNVV